MRSTPRRDEVAAGLWAKVGRAVMRLVASVNAGSWDEVVGRGQGQQMEAAAGALVEMLVSVEEADALVLVPAAALAGEVQQKTVKNLIRAMEIAGLVTTQRGRRGSWTRLTILGWRWLANVMPESSA